MRVLPAVSSSLFFHPANGRSARFDHTDAQAQDGGRRKKAFLYLNVYDISPMNNYLYWLGLGIFHTGIEVHGMEYGFGAHDYPTSGVFEVEPKNCPGFVFRRSLCIGTTEMSRQELRLFIEELAGNYHGDTYHLIVKNCNHFTADVCRRLTGKSIPGWVNRLARFGSLCNCMLPDSIKVSAVRNEPADIDYSDAESLELHASHLESDLDDLDQFFLTPRLSDAEAPCEKIINHEKVTS